MYLSTTAKSRQFIEEYPTNLTVENDCQSFGLDIV